MTTLGCLLVAISAIWKTVDVSLQQEVSPEEPIRSLRHQIENAAAEGDVEMIRRLLIRHEAGACEKWLALKNASAADRKDIVLLAVSLGADVGHVEWDTGWNALHHAALFGSAETTRVLLELGCDPQQRARNGMTPIELARARSSGRYCSREFREKLLKCEEILRMAADKSGLLPQPVQCDGVPMYATSGH